VNALICFAAALSYVFILLFRIPAIRRWRRDHGREGVPAEVWRVAEKEGPYFILVQLVVLCGVVELLRASDAGLAMPFLSSGMPLCGALCSGARSALS